jgi:uncharacterized protein involved in exopolysaccharide biosynthesis
MNAEQNTSPDDTARRGPAETGRVDPYQENVDEGVSLLDFALVLVRHLRIVVYTTAVITFLGVVYTVVVPETFTARSKVVREAQSDNPLGGAGGLSALSSLGGSLGLLGSGSGLGVDAYPAVLSSREVRISVVRDTFYFPEVQKRMTFVDYVNRESGWFGQLTGAIWKYTVGLPGQMLGQVKRGSGGRSEESEYPSEEVEVAIDVIVDMVWTNVDPETGIMTIGVNSNDPVLAARLTDSFLKHLKERVRTLRTEKERETLQFVRSRFQEAEEELRRSEERLANFTDRNKSINSAELETQRERLQRQVRFKSKLYSNLQSQVTQAELQLQRSQPVVTVVEEPVPPIERSAPQRKLIVIIVALFGGILGVCAAFLNAYLHDQEGAGEEQDKIEEIRERLAWAQIKNELVRGGNNGAVDCGPDEELSPEQEETSS